MASIRAGRCMMLAMLLGAVRFVRVFSGARKMVIP
jgi:hypothetical protein